MLIFSPPVVENHMFKEHGKLVCRTSETHSNKIKKKTDLCFSPLQMVSTLAICGSFLGRHTNIYLSSYIKSMFSPIFRGFHVTLKRSHGL